MSYVCKILSESDVIFIEKNAASASTSDAASLKNSIKFLRSSLGDRWVFNAEKNAYLHGTFQFPGDERFFHFYINNTDVKIRVLHGVYKKQSPVQIMSGNDRITPSILEEIRSALIAYYGADEMFAINPVFEGV